MCFNRNEMRFFESNRKNRTLQFRLHPKYVRRGAFAQFHIPIPLCFEIRRRKNVLVCRLQESNFRLRKFFRRNGIKQWKSNFPIHTTDTTNLSPLCTLGVRIIRSAVRFDSG